MDLTGRTAIVTGGAVRIGREISLALADAGVNVAVHFAHSEDEAGRTVADALGRGVRAMAVRADFNDPLRAAAMVFEQTRKELGEAQILINSAAVFEAGRLADVTEDQWDRHFNINLKTPFFLTQRFAAQLRLDERGQIVNIADWRGTRPPADHAAYTLTKSAVVAMTRSLAQDLAPHVQVNAVAPGAILPPPGEPDSYLNRITERIPLRRTGSPEDVTDA
ncbi:MAG: SDR family NAD(P)-dependent oxidoreductase, partial [Planctomycetaceae bacterium]